MKAKQVDPIPGYSKFLNNYRKGRRTSGGYGPLVAGCIAVGGIALALVIWAIVLAVK